MTTQIFGNTINNALWNFSQFQLDTANAISKQDDFANWATPPQSSIDVEEQIAHRKKYIVRKRGWINALYTNKNGKIVLVKMGVKRIMHTVTAS